ncbi:single-stranded DNA-binding protein [bacterium]|nr:single-stranded DNA-binding protein [bacterium]
MIGLNRIFLMGNLTRDPELRYTPNGTAVASFGIAVNRRYTTKEGDRKEEVDFFEVEVWNKQAENCNEYLAKGRGVLLEGRLKQDRWEDESGNKRSKLKIVASTIQFLPRNLDDNTKTEEVSASMGEDSSPEDEHYSEPNLPF